MSKIRVMTPELAERIAAGEVVDRPASVVKELTENAIDAGATRVTVEIKSGGITYIRVTDNGSGIARDDVPAAFLRHATSKLTCADDLDAIGTLGFRGEALASICAMARVELLTCTADETAGTRYRIDGGTELGLEDAGCPRGTTIIVRDLFYNTPARLKFLKKDVAEGNAVAAVLDKLALSHPEVGVRLLRDGRETLNASGDGTLRSAVFAVYGRQFTQDLLPVSFRLGEIAVEGFVSRPAAARASRSMQTFFINGRYVRCQTASAAVERACAGAVMTGKYPACVLQLTIPKETVDVNVHPAKIEVRFQAERPVFDAVYRAVVAALGECDWPRELQMAHGAQPNASAPEPMVVQPTLHTPIQTVLTQPPSRTAESITFRSSGAVGAYQPSAELPVPPPISSPAKAIPTAKPAEVPPMPPSAPIPMPKPAPKPDPAPVQMQLGAENPEPTPSEKPDSEAEVPAAHYPQAATPLRLVGELFATYLVLEAPDEMVLIDKHAAHERILYERLRRESAERFAQQLLTPVVLHLAREDTAVLIENREILKNAGFDIAEFGSGALIVRTAPMMLADDDAETVLTELAAQLQAHRTDLVTAREEWILHNVACRAAIKGGDANDLRELIALAQQLHDRPELRYCPHGRPIYLALTRRALEKQFGRTR